MEGLRLVRVPRLYEFYRAQLHPFYHEAFFSDRYALQDMVPWQVSMHRPGLEPFTVYLRYGTPLGRREAQRELPLTLYQGRPYGFGFGQQDGKRLLDLNPVWRRLRPELFEDGSLDGSW